MAEVGESPFESAWHYASLGWRVVPIKDQERYPLVKQWVTAATTDTSVISEWWQRWPNAGVGIVLGPETGMWVLDIDDKDGKHGSAEVEALERMHGKLPETLEATTPSGGRHLFFSWPDGVTAAELHNDQSGKIAERAGLLGNDGQPLRAGTSGLDVRAAGGQVVAAPTKRGGRPYIWAEFGPDGPRQPVSAPQWLLKLVMGDHSTAEIPTPQSALQDVARQHENSANTSDDPLNPDGPAKRFNAGTNWRELLLRDGWTLVREFGNGEIQWTRPGKSARDGISATTGHEGRDVLKVFTSSMPELNPEQAYSRFGYVAAMHHGGNTSSLASELKRAEMLIEREDEARWLANVTADMPNGQGKGKPSEDHPSGDPFVLTKEDVEESGWVPVDLDEVLSVDYVRPVPDVLSRSDGEHIFYQWRVNAIIGDSGAGKSFVTQYACVQEIRAGHNVIYVDYEDHVSSLAARLMAMGLIKADLVAHFRYIKPERSWNKAARALMAGIIASEKPTLCIIDSTGEAMSLDGAKPNDDDATATWFRMLPKFIASLGPAVIMVDHMVKDSDGNRSFSIGSQRKRAAIDGHQCRVDVNVAPAKGVVGRLTIVTNKDRNGHWPHEKACAQIVIEDDLATGGITFMIDPPGEATTRPTFLMERISRYIESEGELPRTAVIRAIKGRESFVRLAMDVLVREDYIMQKPVVGKRGGYSVYSLKPYRDESRSPDDPQLGATSEPETEQSSAPEPEQSILNL